MSDTNSSSPKSGLAIIHILAFLLVIVLNTMAIVLPLNGKSTKQLSDQYPNLFTPVGLTFSIWGVIYLFLFGFTIYQAIILFKKNHSSRDKVLNISKPFLISCIANASWIIAWHYEQVLLSVCIMLVLLGSLVTILEKLKLAHPVKSVSDTLLIDVTFSIYLGWISIATIANITAFLIHIGWNGGGMEPAFWAVIMISVGTLLNLFMVSVKKNIAFGLVGIWAFAGIIMKRQLADGENTNQVIFCAQLGISVIAVSIALQMLKYWKRSAEHTIVNERVAESESL